MSIPEQSFNGMMFGGPEDRPVLIIAPPGESPLDTPAQREFYTEIKDKTALLIGACGSSNRLGRTRDTASRLLAAMGEDLLALNERIFWSRMNSLRRSLEADRRARSASDPETPPMPEEIAGHLEDLVDTLNVFASGDPRLVEIDQQSIDPTLRIATEELTKAAQEIAAAARYSPETIERAAAEVLSDTALDAEGDSPSAARAREFSIRSSRNLALELLRRAYRLVRDHAAKGTSWAAKATAGAIAGGIGTTVFVDFVVRNQALMHGLIRDLPAQETLRMILDLIVRLAP